MASYVLEIDQSQHVRSVSHIIKILIYCILLLNTYSFSFHRLFAVLVICLLIVYLVDFTSKYQKRFVTYTIIYVLLWLEDRYNVHEYKLLLTKLNIVLVRGPLVD